MTKRERERERREKREKDLPFALALKSAKPNLSFALCHLPIRFSELANTPHLPVHFNAKANGKWQMHRRRLGFADFNAKAKWQMMIGQREREREERKGII